MYLQKCVLFFVLQDSLQKILEQLSLRLFTDHRLHEKRRVLLMYRLICRRMLRDLEGGLGGGFVFILREIIHRLVYLLQEMREQEGYLYTCIFILLQDLCVWKNCIHCNFLFVWLFRIRNEERHANNISCMALELLHDVLKTAILINSKVNVAILVLVFLLSEKHSCYINWYWSMGKFMINWRSLIYM